MRFIAAASLLNLLLAATAASADGNNNVLHFRNPEAFHSAVLLNLKDEPLQHYGHPPEGCDSDEFPMQIAGVPGAVCVPKCDAYDQCPMDIPDGVTATPQCALENQQTGDKYCVLICHEASTNLRVGDAQCGEATCQIVQAGLGVCTYE